MKKWSFFLAFTLVAAVFAKKPNASLPDESKPKAPKGYTLVWNDEFNYTGKPDSASWGYEQGFVRNQELQWYQHNNATCEQGVLKIVARRENILNPQYDSLSSNWRLSRRMAHYSSACVTSVHKKSWLYGRFEVRARIPLAKGSWPAIWTLGVEKPWPYKGEIDMMEYYLIAGKPSLLANAAWGSVKSGVGNWDGFNKPLSYFQEKDSLWSEKFHIWRMDWDQDFIRLYLDDELLNEIDLSKTINPDGFNPFHQPHYMLLNLAIGVSGGDPSGSAFPMLYEVDYVRVYQKK